MEASQQDPFAAGAETPQDDPFADSGMEPDMTDPADEVEVEPPVVDKEGEPVDPAPGPAPEQPPGFPGGAGGGEALPEGDPASPAAPSTDAPEGAAPPTPAAPVAAPQAPGEEPTAPPAQEATHAPAAQPPPAAPPAAEAPQAQEPAPRRRSNAANPPQLRHYKLLYATAARQWTEHELKFEQGKEPPGVTIKVDKDGKYGKKGERWMVCRNNEHALKVAFAILGNPQDGVTVFPCPAGAYKPKRVKPKPPAPERTRLDIS